MTNIDGIRTFVIAASLLLSPMVATAEIAGRPAPPSSISDGASDVAALRCEVAGLRSKMIFVTCLGGCARKQAFDAVSYDDACEDQCIDRRMTRDDRLDCANAGEDSAAEDSAELARTQLKRLPYKQRADCYSICRDGGMTIAACEKSCF